MKVFFHVPEFFPRLKFFYGLLNSDLWVILDNLQFKARSRQNRCRIRTRTGVQLLAVSVKRPCNKPICQMMINNLKPWKKLFFTALETNYSGTPYYGEYIDELKYYVDAPNILLETLTVQTTLWLAKILGSTLPVIHCNVTYRNLTKNQIIKEVCSNLRATAFQKKFKHPHYKQKYEPFAKGLSILDPLFCIGAQETRKLLTDG